MKEIELTTSLDEKDIEKNFSNVDFFAGIMEGLSEAIAYENGDAKTQTKVRKRSFPM